MTVCGWSLSSHGRSGALRSSRAGWTEELRFYPGGVNAHVHSVVCACPTPFWTICRNELGVSGNITHATVLLKLSPRCAARCPSAARAGGRPRRRLTRVCDTRCAGRRRSARRRRARRRRRRRRRVVHGARAAAHVSAPTRARAHRPPPSDRRLPRCAAATAAAQRARERTHTHALTHANARRHACAQPPPQPPPPFALTLPLPPSPPPLADGRRWALAHRTPPRGVDKETAPTSR